MSRARRLSTGLAVLLTAVLLGACTPGGGLPGQTPSNVSPAPHKRVMPNPTLKASTVPVPVPEPEPAGESGRLLATLANSDEIAILNPAKRDSDVVEARIQVGQAPWGIGAHGDRAYVATAEGLAVVNLATRTRSALVQYQNPADSLGFGEYREGGLGVAVSPDGGRVYVAVNHGPGQAALEIFDTASGAFIGQAPVGLRPFDVLITADGKRALSVDHDSFSVTVVDTETFVPTTIKVAPFGTEGGLGSWEKPHYGALDGAGRLLLPVQGQKLVVLDPATGQSHTEDMTGNSHQHGAAVATDPQTGQELLLGVGTGSFGSATGGLNLTVRSLETGSERLIPLNKLHETVTSWIDPETGHQQAVLAGGYTRAGGWDGLTMVDLTTGNRTEASVPGYPQVVIQMPTY